MKKIKVSKKAKTLLRETIDEKWKPIASGKGGDNGRVNCFLCQKYLDFSCASCPIYKKTGHKYCKGTPYEEWDKHHDEKHITLGPRFPLKIECPICKELAEKELEFLENLDKEVTTI